MTQALSASTFLAFDTTHGTTTVVCMEKGRVVAKAQDDRQSKQAELLVQLIEAVLVDAHKVYADMDAIIVNVGPGSFTGIRIGLACAKGLALASHKPLIGVNGFEIVMQTVLDEQPSAFQSAKQALVVLDAKRNELYAQRVRIEKGELFLDQEPFLLGLDELSAYVAKKHIDKLIEDECSQISKHFPLLPWIGHKPAINAQNMARTALKNRLLSDGYKASPLYVRRPDAKLPSSPKS